MWYIIKLLLLVELILSLMSNVSEGEFTLVQPDEFSTVTLVTSLPKEQCSVCKVKGQAAADSTCSSSVQIQPRENASLSFNCTEPKRDISVQIHTAVACNKSACIPAEGKFQPTVLLDFNRTYIWDISVPEGEALRLQFPGDGYKEIMDTEICPDSCRFSVTSSDLEGMVKTQLFCQNGEVMHLDVFSQTKVTLEVPQGKLLDTIFTLTEKPKEKKGRTMAVKPDPDTIVHISRLEEGAECSVCLGEGASQSCSNFQRLNVPHNTTVHFTCSSPEDIYSVEINKELDCTETVCNSNAIHPESSYFPDFNRTFTWDLKVPISRGLQLDFPEPGMRQISPGEQCPNMHTYTIITYQRIGPVTIGTFCHGGAINQVQVLYKGRVSLFVPGEQELIRSNFKVSVGPETNAQALVNAKLPRGQSYTDFYTINYPKGVPSGDVVKWNFAVEPMHNYTVLFQSQTQPACQSKAVELEYQQGTTTVKKTLTEPQPANKQGDFSMTLSNCEVGSDSVDGLSLSFRVSVFRSGLPYLCSVDLQNEEGLSLLIENKNPNSYCEMSMDSVVVEKITVNSGTKSTLSFLDCPNEDLLLTLIKTLECESLSACTVNGTLLTIPPLEPCLPMPLNQVTWLLRVPEHGTVDLTSPQGNLHQSVPGKECNGSVSLLVSEGEGFPIGHFCSLGNKGAIRKVQIGSAVNITTVTKGSLDLKKERGPFFNVSFGPEILEHIIYKVSPVDSVLLATPNWPENLKPLLTVSWAVEIPEEQFAELVFANLSQPKCDVGHTDINVRKMGTEKEILNLREDNTFDDKLKIKSSFYLNMSNCEPHSGRFAVLSKIILQPKTRKLLSIILGTVLTLLVLTIIVLAVVCVVMRKKRQKMNSRSSIYIPKGNAFLPGDASFPKSRADNESHVYAAIDDTMVYGHLLSESGADDTTPGRFNGNQVDTYHTFTGPPGTNQANKELPADYDYQKGRSETDGFKPYLDPSESFLPARPRTPLGPVLSLGYEDRRMVDNELNTFKSSGEPNPIRLSAVEPEANFQSESSPEQNPEYEYDEAM